jgi:hypothetical protein
LFWRRLVVVVATVGLMVMVVVGAAVVVALRGTLVETAVGFRVAVASLLITAFFAMYGVRYT